MDIKRIMELAGLEVSDARIAKEDVLAPKEKKFGVGASDQYDIGVDGIGETDDFEDEDFSDFDDLDLDLPSQKTADAKPDVDELEFNKKYEKDWWGESLNEESGINNPDYKYYVLVQTPSGLKIESGWEYREDAYDQLRNVSNYAAFVTSKVRLPLDPEDDSNWDMSEMIGKVSESPQDPDMFDEIEDGEEVEEPAFGDRFKDVSSEPDYEKEYDDKYWPSDRELLTMGESDDPVEDGSYDNDDPESSDDSFYVPHPSDDFGMFQGNTGYFGESTEEDSMTLESILKLSGIEEADDSFSFDGPLRNMNTHDWKQRASSREDNEFDPWGEEEWEAEPWEEIDNASLELNLDDVPTAGEGEGAIELSADFTKPHYSHMDEDVSRLLKLSGLNEADSLKNGYGNEKTYHADDTFPTGADTPIVKKKGINARQGDNTLPENVNEAIKRELWESLKQFKNR
jgi:hypothetical protein